MTQLCLTSVALQVGRSILVKDVSCSIGAGQVTGLIGPNGAGKSTLLMAMAGLVSLASGSIALDGRTLNQWQAGTLARRRAYLPQTASIHWPITVSEAVALGRLPFGDAGGAGRAAVLQAIEDCDLGRLASRPVSSLSGGERARVHLARLLAQQPALILADEPASELDPAHQLRALALLRQAAARGAAVVVVLHDLTAAARWCDRILLLAQGGLMAEGPPTDVLTAPILAAAFGIDVHIGSAGILPYVVPLQALAQ